ncbi:sulfite exporter TauE/SafE family protein, partial [Rhodobaculum claviforme]|uniref:sulfite exporter TauE/SafE family protein n=1 Tax=Rhodobaculum claviforme TaxID=1549854 RepID=UPI0019140BEF
MQIYLPIAEVTANVFVLLGIGGVAGVLSGMFGVGGGFLITPLLLLIGIPPAAAVATGVNQVIASSVSGVLAHFRRGNVDLVMGNVMLMGGMVGSGAGVWIFSLLRAMGQTELLVQLSYVLFLGVIGALVCTPSQTSSSRRTRPSTLMRRRAACGPSRSSDTSLIASASCTVPP